MPHEFSTLFAELAQAEAELGRRVRKCRNLLANRKAPAQAPAQSRESRLFDWRDGEGD